ncbi:M14 family metallopeptidase [Schlesneria paludicola]|uniref:succinylglutamate desuccinylase/aspartoacylase domain-containing protein n=1 Tax=Schlesneria paludicola TaxID=360056 RepID=UPI00029A0E1B|nr:succinylglutamate desuccinylase/aspartoacylase family protein [Schlesneria paludicola]
MTVTRQIVKPANLDLESPGRRDYWVALEHDTMWGAQLIPLTVWVGPKAQTGRGLVAIGSTHGNEYEGPVVLKELLGEINTADVTGRIIFIPVLNVEAFRSGTRDSVDADRVNLNRAFVDGAGKQSGLAGITHRMAAFIRDYIWPNVHVVIDLHSGGNQIRFDICASFHPVDDPDQHRKIAETARWFGAPLIMIYQNNTPGLLTSEAERLGKITIGTELGWGEAVLRKGVTYARQGVLAAAIHHGQLQGTIAPIAHHADGTQKCAAIVDFECYVAAPFAGHYEEVLPCGQRVKRGELVGRLHDFARIDEPAWPVCAGVDGVVVAQAWSAKVRQGQFILCVGREQPWPLPQ